MHSVKDNGQRNEDKIPTPNATQQGKKNGFLTEIVEDFKAEIHSAEDDEQINHDKIQTPNATQQEKKNGVWTEIIEDFSTDKGDQKILRAIGRTAAVNLVVTATAALGPISGVAGYLTGGAITAKRLGEGVENGSKAEVAKSLAVFGSATSASVVGQAATGALMIGVIGASLPVAGAVAFSVGCVSGITAGALSEWGVDSVMKTEDKKNKISNDRIKNSTENEKDVMSVSSTSDIQCGGRTGTARTSNSEKCIMRRDQEVGKVTINIDGEEIMEEQEKEETEEAKTNYEPVFEWKNGILMEKRGNIYTYISDD